MPNRPIKEIALDKETLPQLVEIFNTKFDKGDIQAEFDLSNQLMGEDYKIRLNLKQLFIVIQALMRLTGNISVKEVNPEMNNSPFTRSVFILRDGSIVKDITLEGASIEDIRVRNEGALIENKWQKEL